MNSIHRGGLMVAAMIAGLTIVGAFVVDGYVSGLKAAAEAATSGQATATLAATATPSATETIEPETVYVEPVPTPAVIKVTRTSKPAVVPAGPTATPPVIHVIVPGPTGGDGGGGDGGGD